MSAPTQYGRTVGDVIELLPQATVALLCVRIAVRPRGFEQHDYLMVPPAVLEQSLRAHPLERPMPSELIGQTLYVGSLDACRAVNGARIA